jgi:Tfp pilus assembly protein PilF
MYNMGMCHYRLRQLDQARQCMVRTLELNSELPQGRKSQGRNPAIAHLKEIYKKIRKEI